MGGPETPLSISVAARRWGLQVTGLAMIVAGAIWAAVALASTTIQIDGLKGGDKVTVDPEKVDVDGVLYNLPDGRKRIDGYSLEKVLNQVGIGDAEWSRIFVSTSGGTVEVREDEVFSGEREPVFALPKNGDDVYFIRPKKGSQPAEFARANTLRLNYRVGMDIEPELEDPETGDTVTFSALAPGPESSYSFEWTASSGETGTGKTFEYTFPSAAGRVQINVEASRGGNVVAEQTIGTPVKAPPQENTGGSGSSGFGSSGFGSGGFGTTPDFPSSDFSDPNFPDVSPTSPGTPTPDAPKPDDTPIPEVAGTNVTGELLSDVGPLPPSSAAPGDPSSTKPEPDEEVETAEEAKDVSAPGALIAGGIIVGLLGLGAGREFEGSGRGLRMRRPDLNALRRLSPPWK